MKALVLGGTGMTGRSLVKQLLDKGHTVRAIVRSLQKLPDELRTHSNLELIEGSLLDLSQNQLEKHVRGCDAVVSCLGHVMSFSGVFGHPRRLCTEATERLCRAIEANEPREPVKFILMNTVGVRNPHLQEKRTLMERGLLAVLGHTLPPQRDNETAAEHLDRVVGKGSAYLEWCCVRPDSLINAEVSRYEIEPSPITGILSGRPTARSNVAHFMMKLIEDPELWATWRFQMPVIMNAAAEET